MNLAIIGGGFTGLSAAVELIEADQKVTIFEAEKKLGGLAVGFRAPDWGWSLERYYHHIFAGDKAVIKLAAKVGWPAFFSTPKTNSFIGGEEKQLDSPLSLLRFDKLGFLSRLHMGAGLAFLKLIPDGTILERIRIVGTLPCVVGREGYEKIWEPLLKAKFGPFLTEANLAWFWARVNKRTQSLGYFEGGFQTLAEKIGDRLRKQGVEIRLGHKVKTVKPDKKGAWWVDGKKYDGVLITTPAPLVDRLVAENQVNWPKINYLTAQTLVLELKQSLMKGYWLNILEKDFPFMVVVEQTNFTDKINYGNKTVVYLGNYLPAGDKRLEMDEEGLIKLFAPYIKKINPSFERSWITGSWCFESPFAQPVFPINYSKMIPPIKTVLPNLYVANQSMVYPWDRGTNFAVEIGQKAAGMILSAAE